MYSNLSRKMRPNAYKGEKPSSQLFLWVGLVTLFLAVTLSACRKQVGEMSEADSFTEVAKDWFQNEVVSAEKEKLETLDPSLPKGSPERQFARMGKLGEKLIWSAAKEYSRKGFEFVVVPVQQALKPFKNQSVEAARALIFFKSGEGKMQLNVVECISKRDGRLIMPISDIAGEAFMNRHFKASKAIGSLSANIVFYDQNYQYLSSYETNNGKWGESGFKLLNKKMATVKKRIPSTKAQTLSCVGCVNWILVAYTYNLSTGIINNYVILDSWDVCDGSTQETASGYGDVTTTENIKFVQIDFLVSDPCLKNSLDALDRVTSGISGTLFEWACNTFGNSDLMNLSFQDGHTLDPNVFAQWSYTTNGDMFNGHVTLDDNKLRNVSKEYQVTAILHELYHGYLEVSGKAALVFEDHNLFASYRNHFANQLLLCFPNLSIDDAYCLSWAGLTDYTKPDGSKASTIGWRQLSDTERTKILNVLSAFITKAKGTPC